jgi:pSer/pThr/pTyr-binding forkhead associated (FHA) protein
LRADYGRRPTPREISTGPSGDETVLGDTIGGVSTGRLLGVLVVTEGPLEGFVARVVEGKNALGREGHPDPIPKQEETRGISRLHATLEAEAGGFVIEPTSDRSAVFVNEQLVDQRTLLSHGDRIRLGMKQPLTLVLLVVP